MTRLTDAPIDEVVERLTIHSAHYPDLRALLAAYQSVREERDDAISRIASLTAALAEVTKERDNSRAERADLTSRNTALRAQLATAKREYRHDCAEWHNEGIGCTHCHRVIYPATPSGESENDQCACGDVAVRNWEGYAFCAKCCATSSPEAREVPSEVVGRVTKYLAQFNSWIPSSDDVPVDDQDGRDGPTIGDLKALLAAYQLVRQERDDLREFADKVREIDPIMARIIANGIGPRTGGTE